MDPPQLTLAGTQAGRSGLYCLPLKYGWQCPVFHLCVRVNDSLDPRKEGLGSRLSEWFLHSREVRYFPWIQSPQLAPCWHKRVQKCSGWSQQLARAGTRPECELCTFLMTWMAVDVKSFYGLKRPRSCAADGEEEQNTSETGSMLQF